MGDVTALRPVRRTQTHVDAPKIEFMAGVPDDAVHSLEAEEEYCAALVGDEYAIVATRQDVLPVEFDFAQPRSIVEAAHALLTAIPPQVVTRATLINKLKELERWPQTVNDRYLDYLDDKATSKVIRAAKDNAFTVRMYFQAREQSRITKEASEATLLEPHRVIEIGADTAERILKLHANTGRVGDDPSPRSIRERATQRQEEGIPTGMSWFDKATGGLRRARLIGIQGQQKSRKTSLLTNLLQQPLMDGHTVSIFEYDNTAEEIWRRFVAMVATEMMRQESAPMAMFQLNDEPVSQQLLDEYPGLADYIQRAEDIVDGWKLHIYDLSHEIRDVDIVERLIMQDAAMGCEIVAIDYIQEMKSTKIPDHEEVRQFKNSVSRMHGVITKNRLSGIILSQRSEEANKEGDDYKGAGALGGGALLSKVDFLLESKPLGEYSIRVRMKAARRAAKDMYHDYRMNPSSGWIHNKLDS
jgi:hypothetical protein